MIGAAIGVDISKHLSIGAAFNEVRDGVSAPGPNEPKEGDQAALFAARYLGGPFLAAVTYSPTRNHMVDDKGAYLGTQGWELFLQYDAGRHWQLLGGFNSLSWPCGATLSPLTRSRGARGKDFPEIA